MNQSCPINRLDKVDISFEDHSGGHFHLYAQKCVNSSEKMMKLSAKLPAWQEIGQDSALIEILKEQFGDLWMKEVDEGFDVTISCKINEISENGNIEKFSNLKQLIISSPIARVLNRKDPNHVPFTVKLGNGSNDFYSVVPGTNNDQLIILFGMNFKDQTDTILAKVFLQEFYDVRNNKMEDAPVVLYGKEPPKELQIKSTILKESLNFLTLVLFPRHYSTKEQQNHLLKTLPFLSDYLHYHLKCSKAYLHQRMRAKTGDFLKMLNRSKAQ